jgi:hypothetical protein
MDGFASLAMTESEAHPHEVDLRRLEKASEAPYARLFTIARQSLPPPLKKRRFQ